ncbi:MAG TPA: hypothetical protein V6D19_03525 [Stenomitos sp.]
MVIPITLIILGVLTQVAVLAVSRNKMPQFNQQCKTCRYQLPLMERPPALFDCPECDRQFKSLLSEPLLRL